MTRTIPRALVVDDDPAWQEIISEIIADCGLEVDIAGGLDEAVINLKTNTHRLAIVDLALSPEDHNNCEGLLVLEAARRVDPNCRTILLTGFATVELAVSALSQYGAFTFLRKENFQRAQFREIVSSAMAAPLKVPLSSNIITNPTIQKETVSISHKTEISAEKALIVEDDAGWRSILTELLTDAGFQVRACTSFGDSLGNIHREKFTLAVVDLSLTGAGDEFWQSGASTQTLGGYQLLTTLREENIPTIVVSGVSSPDEIEGTYAKQDIFSYIEKQTFERATFQRVVEEARALFRSSNELSSLTDREREVLTLLSRGMPNKHIAESLTITTNTVKRHIKSIFEKLNVHTRSAAAAKAISEKV